jgi:ABC-type glycerol-3-phosphate transport system substrate-binding protein
VQSRDVADDTAYGVVMRTTALRKGPSVALSLLLTATSVAACSSGSTGSYCDALTAAEADWKDAGATLKDPAAAARFVATITSVEASAPEEVRTDWASLRVLVAKFTVAKPDLTELTKHMEGFESSAKRIETHAKETCGIDLGS